MRTAVICVGAVAIVIAGLWSLSDLTRGNASKSVDRAERDAPIELQHLGADSQHSDATVVASHATQPERSTSTVDSVDSHDGVGASSTGNSDNAAAVKATSGAESVAVEDEVGSYQGTFPMSASIKRGCLQYSDACKLEHSLLAILDSEPQDDVWAAGKEKLLLESVRAHPGQVRTLKCKSTICAIEVASPPPTYHGLMPSATAYGLSEVAATYAYEKQDGQQVNVTLRIWKRVRE